MTLGLATIVAQLFGGAVMEVDGFGLGWRAIFIANVPMGIAAFIAAHRLLRESRAPRGQRLDRIGIVLLSIALTLVFYPLVEGRELGWPWWMFACLIAALPACFAFIAYERWKTVKDGSALVDFAVFQNARFLAGLATAVFFFGGLSAFFLTATLWLQQGMRFSPLQAGLVFVVYAVGFSLAASASTRWSARSGASLVQLGSASMIAGLAGLIACAHWGAGAHPALGVSLALAVYGFGQGLVIPSLVQLVLAPVEGRHAGLASGVYATVQQMSLALGVVLIGGVFFARLGSRPGLSDYSAALPAALQLNIALLMLACAFAFLLRRAQRGAFDPSSVHASARWPFPQSKGA